MTSRHRLFGEALPPAVPLKGRRQELATLASALTAGHVRRLALVGGGGSGKSVLAAALARKLRRRFAGGAVWLRVGNWDHRTLLQMLALRLGATRDPLIAGLCARLRAAGPMLVVLDNHENDREMARLLEVLADPPVTWILTARRCLLSGVSIFPVVAPLIQSRQDAFPEVRGLTSSLRWNPLALGIASALVRARAVTAAALKTWLERAGVDRVRVMAHEDDVTEVRLLVDWAWRRLAIPERRLLAVLASCPGDHMDAAALAAVGRARHAAEVLQRLRRWELVQEPLPDRFALHAVVRYAVADTVAPVPAARYFEYYVRLLERNPERFVLEQSHLFAAMDHAQAISSLEKMLRIEALLSGG
jgi:hypothetical protein